MGQKNVDPAVVPPLFIVETGGQVHGVFVGQKACLLLERFVFVVERVVHEVVFQKAARPQSRHQEADVSRRHRCDVEYHRRRERQGQVEQPPVQEEQYEARHECRADSRPCDLLVLYARRPQAREGEQHDGKEFRVEYGMEQVRRAVEVHQDSIDHADIHAPREYRFIAIPVHVHYYQ